MAAQKEVDVSRVTHLMDGDKVRVYSYRTDDLDSFREALSDMVRRQNTVMVLNPFSTLQHQLSPKHSVYTASVMGMLMGFRDFLLHSNQKFTIRANIKG